MSAGPAPRNTRAIADIQDLWRFTLDETHLRSFPFSMWWCCLWRLAPLFPYLSTLGGYFLGDDFGLVHEFHDRATFHFLSLFTRSWDAGVYGDTPDELRPILALSYQFDFFWGAGSPSAFHITNLVFHLLNGVLVFTLARTAAGLRPWAAALAMAVFLLFPTHAETVAWISGRADSLPAVFYLGAFLAYVLWTQSRKNRAWLYGLSVATFFLALFTKQYAITMIGTLLAYDVLVSASCLVVRGGGLRDICRLSG